MTVNHREPTLALTRLRSQSRSHACAHTLALALTDAYNCYAMLLALLVLLAMLVLPTLGYNSLLNTTIFHL